MVHERRTTQSAAQVIAQAKRFFAERVPHHAAYPEAEGPTYLQLRGQGGEEIALAILSSPDGGARVRASTLFHDQAVKRFLATLQDTPGAA